MALVKAKVLGNPKIEEYSVDTIGELKEALDLKNYSASVNGQPQSDSFALEDAQLVTFAPSVKGGKQ